MGGNGGMSNPVLEAFGTVGSIGQMIPGLNLQGGQLAYMSENPMPPTMGSVGQLEPYMMGSANQFSNDLGGNMGTVAGPKSGGSTADLTSMDTFNSLSGFAPDTTEQDIQSWQGWKGTPPINNSPDWQEAQRRNNIVNLGNGQRINTDVLNKMFMASLGGNQQQNQMAYTNPGPQSTVTKTSTDGGGDSGFGFDDIMTIARIAMMLYGGYSA